MLLYVQHGDVQSARLRYLPVPGLGYHYGMDFRYNTRSAYTVLRRQTHHHQPGLGYAGTVRSISDRVAQYYYIRPQQNLLSRNMKTRTV